MTRYVDPFEALARWADDPRYGRIHLELHPSRSGAIALSTEFDDALVCMATLAAIITRRELLLAGDDYARPMQRVEAVADCCGFDISRSPVNTPRGSGVWVEFMTRQVTA